MLQVFVYGTLKPGECNYQIYCGNRTIDQCQAYTWGELYDLPLGYPAMTVGKSKVMGFLLTFANENILSALDKLEDYHPDRSPQENEYHRQLIPVYNPSGRFLGQAWGYLMTIGRVKQLQGVPMPSGCWESQGIADCRF